MDASLPSSIELSPGRRAILELFIEEQANIAGGVELERTILLWAEGTSESSTAQRLGISKERVRVLRYRCWASTASIAAAETRMERAITNFVGLIFRTRDEEPSPEPALHSTDGATQTPSASRGSFKKSNDLRTGTKALIEILHHKPNAFWINRSNWTLGSLAEAFGKLYGLQPSTPWVWQRLKKAGLKWKKSRKILEVVS